MEQSGMTVAGEPIVLSRARVPIAVRPGTMADVPFMDKLQRATTKQVGFMPTKQFEAKVQAGHVLIAEAVEDCGLRSSDFGLEENAQNAGADPAFQSALRTPQSAIGYLIAQDQYFKRDDVGVIYQINVAPDYRRSLVAAMLLKAQFERSAWGCKLYCCWCAQDIEANRFWESMGFVPLAYRAGSAGKLRSADCGVRSEAGNPKSEIRNPKWAQPRVHIFWQKRIRQGDASTPWWFPSKTGGGSLREDRLVLPIPPGVHWSDAVPLIMPNAECQLPNEEKQVKAKRSSNRKSQIENRQSISPANVERFGLRMTAIVAPAAPETTTIVKNEAPPTRAKRKHDPKLEAAVREMKDRWLEHVNAGAGMMANGKYEVSRAIEGPGAAEQLKVLPAA